MNNKTVRDQLHSLGVVPVIAIDDAKEALGLADALIAGGLPVAEITFRTMAAADVIKTITKQRPQMLVGAGTILSEDNLFLAKECGAQFIVAPGFNPAIVKKAMQLDIPIMPGVMTPTEAEQALALGCHVLKFFPAELGGGVKMLNALSAPYRHTGVSFMPTGGVSINNLKSYLELDTVMAVGGTWLAKKEDIADHRWDIITQRCREARKTVTDIRG